MPQPTIQFAYSKRSGFAALAVLIIFGLLLLKTCIDNYRSHDMVGTVIFGVFVTIVLALLALMVVTRLIPALRGEIALELDDEGVKDYIRNFMLPWNDVEDIGLKPGRSSAMLLFELKFESDYGSRVAVSLRWVAGRDREIFDTVLAYFDESQGIVREEGE